MIRLVSSLPGLSEATRYRHLVAGTGLPGVLLSVPRHWVGSCVVRYQVGDYQVTDVISSVDEAMVVAGLLSSPLAGAEEVRVEASDSGQAGFTNAVEWGRARLGGDDLTELLRWWAL